MQHQITPAGNLEILCEEGDQENLREMLDKATHMDHGFLADLLEDTGWSPNGRLYQVRPEWIAALTDAPILTDDLSFEEDGTALVCGRVWWFPNYMVESFAETLINTGSVIFTAAYENEERKAA